MPIINLNWMRWDAIKQAKVVGWPLPKSLTDLWAYERIADAAPEYKAAGFDKALFMPSTLGAASVYSGGYDKKEDYVFEPTAWGSEAMCIEAVSSLSKEGIEVIGDAVLHQMDGYPKQQYNSAIFPKDPTCFAWDPGMTNPKYPGNVAPDSVPDPSGGWPDGDLCAYDQANRYMWNGAIAAILNQMKVLGIRHWRIDECKDLHAPFLCAVIDAVHKVYPDAQFTGEYFDGNPYALGGWVNYWMGRRASVFDFMFKFNVGNICNNNSNVWMGQLSRIGYNMQDSMKAVTFCENADTDTSPGEQTIWNKQLAYDIMFSFPGEPMTYYRDWSDDANCYDMKARINNGLWRWHNLAQGDFVTRNAEYQTFAHERLGYRNAPGCLCFFNNDQYNAHIIPPFPTRYGPNRRMHEYSGNAGYSSDFWTDWRGWTPPIQVPRNVNGCNSLCYGVYL